MTETNGSPGLRGFAKRHWVALAGFAIGCAVAFAGAITVFIWFASQAQSTGLVPTSLGLWTLGNLVSFIVYAAFWELLLVGVPVAGGILLAWYWWNRLPSDERASYRFARSKNHRNGGWMSFVFFAAFCLKVYLDGNWNLPIANYTLDYVVATGFTLIVWFAVLFGVPAAIAGLWWVRHRNFAARPQGVRAGSRDYLAQTSTKEAS